MHGDQQINTRLVTQAMQAYHKLISQCFTSSLACNSIRVTCHIAQAQLARDFLCMLELTIFYITVWPDATA